MIENLITEDLVLNETTTKESSAVDKDEEYENDEEYKSERLVHTAGETCVLCTREPFYDAAVTFENLINFIVEFGILDFLLFESFWKNSSSKNDWNL
jgi:hypothetical protein